MVKTLCMTILMVILTPFILYGQDVSVAAEVGPYNLIENQPLVGTVEVTHDQDTKIDLAAFKMDNKPLKVELVKNVKVSEQAKTMISFYRFELQGIAKGLHILPEVSVTVAGHVYSSVPSTYEVTGQDTKSSNPSSAGSSPVPAGNASTPSKVTLRLEEKVDGETTIYPGQQVKFTYFYYYNGNIELDKEELPLLEAKGLMKVGEKEIKDYEKNGMNVREISQLVEALVPGVYTFGPSIIEGRSYEEDELGHRKYSPKKWRSEATTVTITVIPFPVKDKPKSFNGAIGKDLTFHVGLLTPPNVNVGDKISLEIDISGNPTDWNVVLSPELCCQPGFSGLFRVSDLPPVGVVKDKIKQFTVDLYPLTPNVQNIPAIEFSYFDLSSKSYQILHSDPIPIKVNGAKNAQSKAPQIAPVGAASQTPEQPEISQAPSPIEIRGNYPLTDSDLRNYFLGTWWVLSLIPIGSVLILFQIRLKRQEEESLNIVKVKTSQELFVEAIQSQVDHSSFYSLLKEALLLRLVELGEIPSKETPLKDTGKSGDVKRFLSLIEEKRFTGANEDFKKHVKAQAQEMFDSLK